MAELALDLGELSFNAWLSQMYQALGLRKPMQLHVELIRAGYEVREESVRRWLLDAAQPPAKAIPALLAALAKLSEKNEAGVDVYAEFDAWVKGSRPSFRLAPRRVGGFDDLLGLQDHTSGRPPLVLVD